MQFGPNSRAFGRQLLTLCMVYSVSEKKDDVFLRNVDEFYAPARPRVPEDVNQLPSSVTSRVSLLSAVAMASVWWKLVVT